MLLCRWCGILAELEDWAGHNALCDGALPPSDVCRDRMQSSLLQGFAQGRTLPLAVHSFRHFAGDASGNLVMETVEDLEHCRGNCPCLRSAQWHCLNCGHAEHANNAVGHSCVDEWAGCEGPFQLGLFKVFVEGKPIAVECFEDVPRAAKLACLFEIVPNGLDHHL